MDDLITSYVQAVRIKKVQLALEEADKDAGGTLQIGVVISSGLSARLDAACQVLGITKSGLVRAALIDSLDKVDALFKDGE
ncbi:hypothetical protein [Methylovulum psychrotolerans]|uniref:Uncharacterized protein n=1 Tax=Methylovulum psychrotolerans TaxID=1704499 RepID=A0A1Z4BX61_9GAMM|nr:hypothetical protein [Methylovulum psychrotolerans]ASF45852.1 hypothetical protein CEK71_07050 [Methylovulum psychrotolerans]